MEDIFSIIMCRSFTKVLKAAYEGVKYKKTSLEPEEDWFDIAVESYAEMCHKNLELQIDTLETMGTALNELRVIDSDDQLVAPNLTNFMTVAEGGYADRLLVRERGEGGGGGESAVTSKESYGKFHSLRLFHVVTNLAPLPPSPSSLQNQTNTICPGWVYNPTTDEEENFFLSNQIERASLELQYSNPDDSSNTAIGQEDGQQGHYQKCAPTQCEYVEDEVSAAKSEATREHERCRS